MVLFDRFIHMNKIDLSQNHGNICQCLQLIACRFFFCELPQLVHEVRDHAGMAVSAVHADMREVAVADDRQNQLIIQIMDG